MKLTEYLELKGWSQKKMAEKITVTPQAVSRWIQSVGKPDYPQMVKIHDVTKGKVSLKDWQ